MPDTPDPAMLGPGIRGILPGHIAARLANPRFASDIELRAVLPDAPAAPGANPFADLPFPSAGDRIKSEDFRHLAQALKVLSDTFALAGAMFGASLGQAKLALAAQQYEVARVVSVFGTETADPHDTSLDERKVIHVAPLVLGERQVAIVVTEAATETRRFMPDLTGLTYTQAIEHLHQQLGDAIGDGGPLEVPNLVGETFVDAIRRMST